MKDKILVIVLILFILKANASQVDTLIVHSPSMKKDVYNLVVIPENYDKAGKSLPVLYLLHGAGGDFTNWVSRVPAVKEYADEYNMIIVCPDAASTSWYFDSPIDSTMRYETYMTTELIASVDSQFNTIEHSSGRAITGLSMGGHGAFYLAFRHPDIWGAAGSMSGGLDFRPFPQNWEIKERLGPYEINQETWDKNVVVNLIPLLDGKSLAIIFDCGVGDFFFEVNQAMHEKLLVAEIDHDYIVRPGVHNWDYWAEAIKYQLVFFNTFFQTSN
jgi:S-formylglutathione hydrolase FrmB